jgi:hypothetical protein
MKTALGILIVFSCLACAAQSTANAPGADSVPSTADFIKQIVDMDSKLVALQNEMTANEAQIDPFAPLLIGTLTPSISTARRTIAGLQKDGISASELVSLTNTLDLIENAIALAMGQATTSAWNAALNQQPQPNILAIAHLQLTGSFATEVLQQGTVALIRSQEAALNKCNGSSAQIRRMAN